MHDRNGTELKLGDVVLIPAKVTHLVASEEVCNVSLESVHGRRPDDLKESFCINTGVVILHERPSS